MADPDPHPDQTSPGARHLADAQEMRALSHPTRLALLEVLTVHGPLTATEAGKLIGESPASCSFHLRTLARFGFVSETGEGKGRNRPWAAVVQSTTMDVSDMEGDARAAGDALSALYLQRVLARVGSWQARRHLDDTRWDHAAGWSTHIAWITPDELEAMGEEARALLARYADRLEDPSARPEGSRTVELLWLGYPASFGEADPR